MKKVSIILSLLICLVFAGCRQKSYLELEDNVEVASNTEDSSKEDKGEIGEDLTTKEPGYAQISGAVNSPGVYPITENMRLFELVEKAGGLREDAAFDSVNQAVVVEDGQSIYIKTLKEYEESKLTEIIENSIDDGRVNINTADKNKLMTIPGIGETKADMIISYRDTNGSFKTIEDLMNISGIKEGTFNKIKDNVTVGN